MKNKLLATCAALATAAILGLAINLPAISTAKAQTSGGFTPSKNVLSGNVRGATNGSSAPAGSIGEVMTASVASGSALTLSTGTHKTITSITLTPGDWDVSGVMTATRNGATVTQIKVGISSTTGNSATGLVEGSNLAKSTGPTANFDDTVSVPGYRISITATTTYYLKMSADYTVATPNATGRLSARRVR